MKKHIIALLFICVVATNALQAEEVFRNDTFGVSFRHSAKWEPVQTQARSTLVLLYERSGTSATANLSVIKSDRASALDFDKAYFEAIFPKVFRGVKIVSISHKEIYGKPTAFVEFESILVTPEAEIPMMSLCSLTVHEGNRYMLIMNVLRDRASQVRSDFNLMAGTMIFQDR